MDTGDYRREYMSQGIDIVDLDTNPFKQFEHWFKQANDADVQDPTAFSIATCDPDEGPSVRTVLLKLFDEQGFVFFTNYNSTKSKQIQRYPNVAMLFPWLVLNRQVRIEGRCEKISSASSLKYFTTRPRGSQIGAWCSDQSEIIESRSFLEQKYTLVIGGISIKSEVQREEEERVGTARKEIDALWEEKRKQEKEVSVQLKFDF